MHGKEVNSLIWVAASQAWSPQNSYWIKHNSQLLGCKYFSVYRYKVDTFQRETKRSHIWNAGPDGRHSQRSMWCNATRRNYNGHGHFPHKIVKWTLTVGGCYREEENLTKCWICFFNFCFLLLLFTKWILSIHNGWPQGTLLFCLNVKPKCFVQGNILTPSTCGWLQEDINTSLCQGTWALSWLKLHGCPSYWSQGNSYLNREVSYGLEGVE